MANETPQRIYGPVDGKNFEYDWQGGYLEAHLLSDVGRKRKNNEDSCMLCAPLDEQIVLTHGCLFAVADGMGGASAGEYASRMALQTLVEHYYSQPMQSIPATLREALAYANARVFEEAEVNPVYSGMGTTVSAVVILNDWVYVVQVGDSRVYLHREYVEMQQITRDHSLVAEQLRSGLISEEEARNHSLKNLITRAVGIKAEVEIDSFSFQLQRGDTLLLCSDGLCNMVADDAIAEALEDEDLESATRKLVLSALHQGGTDNITALTVRALSMPEHSAPQEGAEEVVLPKGGWRQRLRKFFS